MKKQLILLHGAIGSSAQLKPLAEKLRSDNYDIHTFDFSGHGGIKFKEQFGIEQFSTELMECIRTNDLHSPNIFGYSMGGYVALFSALRHPTEIGNITTLGTKFKWNKEVAEKEVKNLDPMVIEQKVPQFAHRLKELHGAQWTVLLGKTAEMMLRMGERNPLSEQDLRMVQNKVSVGLAETDKMVSLEETDHAANLIEHSCRFTLMNSAHPIETVDLDSLAEQILKN